jgi:hypothetical protein
MSIKKLLLSALLLTTTGFAYAQDATKNYIKLHEDGVIVATVDDSNEGKIDLDLYNDQDWCAMQFDLYLPENVTFPERGWRTVTSRLKYYDPDEDDDVNFTIATNPQADGAIRFVIYNVLNEPIQGNSGKPILKLRFIANDQVSTGELPVIIKNVILSNSVDTSTGTAVVSGFNAEEQETDVTVKINAKVGAGGYGTFSWPRDVVFGDGVEVFTASGTAVNGWLHLDPITDKKVPAGTGVFIKGDKSSIVNPETLDEGAPSVSSTLGATATAPYVAGDNVFALATKNGKTALYPVTKGVEIPQYKAYMTGESGAKYIDFGDTVTSIDALDMAEEDGDIYTLGGQKVQKTTMKGVYIKNGQKVVVK